MVVTQCTGSLRGVKHRLLLLNVLVYWAKNTDRCYPMYWFIGRKTQIVVTQCTGLLGIKHRLLLLNVLVYWA